MFPWKEVDRNRTLTPCGSTALVELCAWYALAFLACVGRLVLPEPSLLHWL